MLNMKNEKINNYSFSDKDKGLIYLTEKYNKLLDSNTCIENQL